MPLLTIVNLTTSELVFQDPTGNSTLSIVVAASATVTDKVVTLEQLAALEAGLIVEATASKITWTTKDDPASAADSPPMSIHTGLVTPVVVLPGDDVVYCKLTSPGAVAVTIPATVAIGHTITVIDGTGDAGTNNITVTATGCTINGNATDVISTNYGMVKYVKVTATKYVRTGLALASVAKLFTVTAAAKDTNGVHALHDAAITTAVTTGITNPDVPRNLRVTKSSSWDGGTITIIGTDQFDNAVTEVFPVLTAGLEVGLKIFKTVTSFGVGDTIGVQGHVSSAIGLLIVGVTTEAVVVDPVYSTFIPTTTPSATTYLLLTNVSG